MKTDRNAFARSTNRRAFFKNGAAAAGAATLGGSLLKGAPFAFGKDSEDSGPPITTGDMAILQFLSAAEQVEADLWTQYSELGGTQDNEVSGVSGGNPLYTAALEPRVSQRRYLAGKLDYAGTLPFPRPRFGFGGHYSSDLDQAQRPWEPGFDLMGS